MQQHRFTYNEAMPVEACTQSLCDLALRFGEGDDEEAMVSFSSALSTQHSLVLPQLLLWVNGVGSLPPQCSNKHTTGVKTNTHLGFASPHHP